MKISRRDFIKACGASAALASVGATIAPPSLGKNLRATPIYANTGNGILIDTSRCIGCRLCQEACKLANNLPTQDALIPTSLSSTTLTAIDSRNVAGPSDKPVIKPVKLQCMHCQEPACASVCPVGALSRKENGVVGYNADMCIGCRYCMAACPFGIPKYDWDSPNPKINKCTFGCMADGKRSRPACVEVCPVQALYYGNRNDLIGIARDRINKNPDKYVNKIYGEEEVGGTAMLYLSDTPFEKLGFRMDLPNAPLPNLTWNAQEKIPAVIGIVVTLLSSIAWWTHRREKVELVEVPVEVSH